MLKNPQKVPLSVIKTQNLGLQKFSQKVFDVILVRIESATQPIEEVLKVYIWVNFCGSMHRVQSSKLLECTNVV